MKRHCDACGQELADDYQTARTLTFELPGETHDTTVAIAAAVVSPFGGSDVCTGCLIRVVTEGAS